MKRTEHYVEYESMSELVRDLHLTEEDMSRAKEHIDDHVLLGRLIRRMFTHPAS